MIETKLRNPVEELLLHRDQPLARAALPLEGIILWTDPIKGLVAIVTHLTDVGLQRAVDLAYETGIPTVVPIPGVTYCLAQPVKMHGHGVSIVCPRSMEVGPGHIDIEWWTYETWMIEHDKYVEECRRWMHGGDESRMIKHEVLQ